jgi:hypothetical protein
MRNNYKKVLVVTEQDELNPTIKALQQWRPDLVKVQSLTLGTDVQTILQVCRWGAAQQHTIVEGHDSLVRIVARLIVRAWSYISHINIHHASCA